MSSLEKKLFKDITVKGNQRLNSYELGSKYYRGISTVNPNNTNPVLYDIALIKQDIINNFHIRQGEKLSDPTFGTIIWDVLFEPLTPALKDAISQNITRIVSGDPRVKVKKIIPVRTYSINKNFMLFIQSWQYPEWFLELKNRTCRYAKIYDI